MASKTSKLHLFLSLNLLFYAVSGDTCVCDGPSTSPPGGGGGGGGGGNTARCPRDALKLGVCANLLGGSVGVVVGSPPTIPCCTLLAGLADVEAAVCLCTAIRANVVGINLNVPLSLSLLLNDCGRTPPIGFTC